MIRHCVLAIVVVLVACGSEKTLQVGDPANNQPPTAHIIAPALGSEGADVTFDATSSNDPDQDELRYSWSFGDGTTGAGPNVNHRYRNDGSYRTVLTVTDPSSAKDTVSAAITIANVAPQITMLKIPDYPVAGGIPVRIQFDFSDPGVDDTVRGTVWIMRPGGAGEGEGPYPPDVRTVEHTFSDPDNYIISLYVEDNDGGTEYRVADHPLVVAGKYYAVFDLGTLGGNSATPVALNDSGHVVGCSTTAAGKTHAFVWSRGAMRDLSPGLDDSCAQVITNSGVIGGVATTGGVEHVAQWSGSAFTDRGPCCQGRLHGVVALTGSELVARGFDVEYAYSSSFWQNGVQRDLLSFAARAMNNKRQIVGSSSVGWFMEGHVDHAFLWENGAMRDLGLLGDVPCAEKPEVMCGSADAVDINNDGVVIGWSTDVSGHVRGVRWINGAVEDLGFPQPALPVAINGAGNIVAVAPFRSQTGGDGYFWRAGVIQTLGSFGGGGTLIADMNDQSSVVGTSLANDHVRHAFVWTPDYGRLIDLGAGPRGAETGVMVIAINARGDIIGRTLGATASRAVLWKVIR